MKIENFLVNVLKLAKAPSLETMPPLEVEKRDIKEIISYLDENNIWYTAINEQELTFQWANINFTVVENDKSADVGLDGKVVEPQQYVAAGLSEEDQSVVNRNTDAAGQEAPLPAVDAVEAARENSETLTDEEFAEQAEERKANAPKTVVVTKKAGKKGSE